MFSDNGLTARKTQRVGDKQMSYSIRVIPTYLAHTRFVRTILMNIAILGGTVDVSKEYQISRLKGIEDKIDYST
jgi:hypothetical protein